MTTTDGVRNVRTALDGLPGRYQPHRLVTLNDHDVKVVTLEGEFVWHTHPDTDELFVVVSGDLTIQLRDGDVRLGPLDAFVVPRGVEHCPLAHGVVQALLVEKVGTTNTGDVGGDRTQPLRELA
ncbi:cupin domain-containing protein [Cellulomonas biazotea]|jgi:mannose-6-phosphate isomerase-like protein (cupin superfamily)|uniref:Cupin type-2 domain-containing protein n=1 Tax=Cellulomonas biazotea TaxID=1709 RepID=A0A402DSV9_9CELL|nr:cupin domain-containing protein [Cellulomonas biazotea]GCE77197.1 hypothetical protein CBZ_22530 [Cellulomonas biazotea]